MQRFKVAMLLRLKFLESMQRRPLFQETPLKHVYVFSDRVTMYPGDEPNRGNGSGIEAYAWYVWEQGYKGTPQIDWIVTTPSDSNTGAAHVLPKDLLIDDPHDILPGLSSEEYEALKTSIADIGSKSSYCRSTPEHHRRQGKVACQRGTGHRVSMYPSLRGIRDRTAPVAAPTQLQSPPPYSSRRSERRLPLVFQDRSADRQSGVGRYSSAVFEEHCRFGSGGT